MDIRVNRGARSENLFEWILNNQTGTHCRTKMVASLLLARAMHFLLYQEIHELRVKCCRRKCPAVN